MVAVIDGDVSFSAGVYTNYYIDAGGMKVYVGAHVDLPIAPGFDAGVGAQGGLLLGLSENVAIDIGVRPTYYVDSGLFSLNAGALGVRAFF